MNKTLEKEKVKDIPELCKRCKYYVEDGEDIYCEYLEVLHPSIFCFRPKDVPIYIRFNKIMNVLDTLESDLYEFNNLYFEDVRNVPKICRRIIKFAKLMEIYYNQAMRGFKQYLGQNNLKFDKNYFTPS